MPAIDYRVADTLRPNPAQSSHVFNKSKRVWRRLHARALAASYFTPSCANVGNLLHKTPSLPSRAEIEDSAGDTSLYLEGYSVWDLGTTFCDLADKAKKSRLQKAVIGRTHASFCHLSNESCTQWLGFEESQHKSWTGSYLFAFVLGWSYVLSARLLELRKESDIDQISYTGENASLKGGERPPSDTTEIIISIGKVADSECRWWAAILASGCGWKATLHRSGRDYFPSWSCHLDREERVQVHHNRPRGSPATSFHPPSSTEAQQYLYNFANHHNAHDQLLAAFHAALTIPEHGRFGASVTLPRPNPVPSVQGLAHPTLLGHLPSTEHLPHFMAFSSIPNTVTSCTLGSLWEPGVTCNLASEWLCPVLQQVFPGLIQEKQFHVIVHMMATRRPNVAPLWLGSAITGLLPRLLEIAGSFLPTISLETTQWTQSPQSFMDPLCYRKAPLQRNEGGHNTIHREDEFRLLYITDVESQQFASPPSCPWAPFGVTNCKSSTIEVQTHAFCGHQPTYSHWVWQGNDGKCIKDYGITSNSNAVSTQNFCRQTVCHLSRLRARLCLCLQSHLMRRKAEFPRCEKLSRAATRNLFTWTLSDGIKPEDRAIWQHEWLEGLLEIENEEDDTGVDSVSSD